MSAETAGSRDAEERLQSLERLVAVQAAALESVPLSEIVPRSVLALLATPAQMLDGTDLPERYRPRLGTLLEQVRHMNENLSLRQRELMGRIATVRAARRAGPAPNLVDRSG
jgi:hypothetical protein